MNIDDDDDDDDDDIFLTLLPDLWSCLFSVS